MTKEENIKVMEVVDTEAERWRGQVRAQIFSNHMVRGQDTQTIKLMGQTNTGISRLFSLIKLTNRAKNKCDRGREERKSQKVVQVSSQFSVTKYSCKLTSQEGGVGTKYLEIWR